MKTITWPLSETIEYDFELRYPNDGPPCPYTPEIEVKSPVVDGTGKVVYFRGCGVIVMIIWSVFDGTTIYVRQSVAGPLIIHYPENRGESNVESHG